MSVITDIKCPKCKGGNIIQLTDNGVVTAEKCSTDGCTYFKDLTKPLTFSSTAASGTDTAPIVEDIGSGEESMPVVTTGAAVANADEAEDSS